MRTLRRPRPGSPFRYSPLVAALACALAPQAANAVTYVVNNTTDAASATCTPAACSLREALQLAVRDCAIDPNPTVAFNIPGTGPFTIAVSSPLPTLTCPSGPLTVTIDGTTQPGHVANTSATGWNATIPIIVSGAGSVSPSCHLIMFPTFPYGGGLVVRGLEMRNFAYGGFGTAICAPLTLTGSVISNNSFGVDLTTPSVIGTPSAGDRNLIVDNTSAGIQVAYGGVAGAVIENNFIGTANGTTAAPNGKGIYLQGNDFIQIRNNVIAGNSLDGIFVQDAGGIGIDANKIGVGAGGGALGNGASGVTVSNVFLGSAVDIFNSTIANNGGDGVSIASQAASGNSVVNNAIFSNAGHGVTIVQGTGNQILQNSIHSNGGKNIDLNFSGGPLPNDPAPDADIGANDLQNHPVVSLVTQSGGNTTIAWSLATVPSTTYTVEFFSNPTAGNPAGRTLIGSQTVTTDVTGNTGTLTTTFAGAHDFISMTATDSFPGNTSEFAPLVALTPTPGVTVAPASLAFGTIFVGAQSASQTATVTSTGTAPYQISALSSSPTCAPGPICASGGFICTTSCVPGTLYAAGQQCTFTATFAPTATGPQTTTIYICDNATGSPRTITLAGDGAPPPPVTISPASFDFGSVMVGSASASATFTIANSATVPASLGTISTTLPFEIVSTTCGSSLVAGASCAATARFVPTTSGAASAFLEVPTSSSPTGSVKAPLSGTGIRQPIVTLPAGPIDLGSFVVGGPAGSRSIELRNTGNQTLSIGTISVSAPFTLVNGCGVALDAGAVCTITIEFDPVAVGTFSGFLTIITNAPGGSGQIAVTAQVQLRPEPLIRVSPATIGYGDRMIGTQSPSQRITISNEGGAGASLEVTLDSRHFRIGASNCGPTLAPQSTCFADVLFQPIAFGTLTSEVVVTSNSEGSPHHVGLGGTGCRPVSIGASRGGSRNHCAP